MTAQNRDAARKRWEGSTPAERSAAARTAVTARWERYRAEQAAKAVEEKTYAPTDDLLPFWVAAGEQHPELGPADRLAQAEYLRRRWLTEGGEGA